MAVSVPAAPILAALLRVAAVVVVLVLGITTAIMNARFGYQLGEDASAKVVLMVFSVALDGLKWLAPIMASAAFANGAKARGCAALILWLVAGGWSFAAAIGFSALNRDVTSSQRQAQAGDRQRAQQAWALADTTLKTLLSSPRWEATKACTNATAPASVAYCAEVSVARAALAKADDRLQQFGAVGHADPQAELVARLTGLNLDQAVLALTIMVAVVAELVSMLGLYAATPPQMRVQTISRIAPSPEPSAPPKPTQAPANPLPAAPPTPSPARAAVYWPST